MRLLPATAFVLAGTIALPLRGQCFSERATPRSLDDVNRDLKEYGWIFEDAHSARCAPAAERSLSRKLAGTLGSGPRADGTRPLQGWLEGVDVEMIHASALVLGGRGLLTRRLDGLVRRTQRRYRYARDPWCDPYSTTNTCFDDQGQAAAAYAWIGAYEALAGRASSARAAFARSERVLHEAFSKANFLCVPAEAPVTPAPCGDGVMSGRERVVVFNHGFEDLGYGIGMVTSFSSALLAFDVGGRPFAFSAGEKGVLRSLFEEGQRGALPDGSAFHADGCLEVRDGALRTDHPCADLGYLPAMFPVRLFYEKRVGISNEAPFRFDVFDGALFSPEDDFLHLGRKAIYGALAFGWWDPATRPPLAARAR